MIKKGRLKKTEFQLEFEGRRYKLIHGLVYYNHKNQWFRSFMYSWQYLLMHGRFISYE